MNYINTLYSNSALSLQQDKQKQQSSNATEGGSSFLDMLKSKSTEGWATQKEESLEKIVDNQTSSIKDAYKNKSVSAMLESARSVYEGLKTEVASQNIQIKPTPTLTSILSKI